MRLQLWKTLTAFHVRCRWAPEEEDISKITSLQGRIGDDEPHEGIKNALKLAREVKIDLHLYKVQRGIFVMDLQRVSGDLFSFMNLCSRIIAELKVSAATSNSAVTPMSSTQLSNSLKTSMSGSSEQHKHEHDVNMQ